MGVRGWWQRPWRRWRKADDGSVTVREAGRDRKDQLASFDTRHRGGNRF
ncbi:MAG TPA: hypothetical protein VGN37_27885 [Actinocatenispora sp.]